MGLGVSGDRGKSLKNRSTEGEVTEKEGEKVRWEKEDAGGEAAGHQGKAYGQSRRRGRDYCLECPLTTTTKKKYKHFPRGTRELAR